MTLTTRDKCPQFAAVNSFVREAGACLAGSHSLLLKDVWLCQELRFAPADWIHRRFVSLSVNGCCQSPAGAS